MSFTFVGITAGIIVYIDLSAFQTKPALISVGVQELCMRPNCPGLKPFVHHPAALLLACSPSFIDFPLLCHCGGLFKHTFCDIWPLTEWHPKTTAQSTNRARPSERLQYHLVMDNGNYVYLNIIACAQCQLYG